MNNATQWLDSTARFVSHSLGEAGLVQPSQISAATAVVASALRTLLRTHPYAFPQSLEGWTLDLTENSASVFTVLAISPTGNTVERTGTDAELILFLAIAEALELNGRLRSSGHNAVSKV